MISSRLATLPQLLEPILGLFEQQLTIATLKKNAQTHAWEILYEGKAAGVAHMRLNDLLSLEVDADAGSVRLPLYVHSQDQYATLYQYIDSLRDFDAVFLETSRVVESTLGPSTAGGRFSYQAADSAQYRFERWDVRDVVVYLLQDEFDLEFGLDVSLWFLRLPADGNAPTLPLRNVGR